MSERDIELALSDAYDQVTAWRWVAERLAAKLDLPQERLVQAVNAVQQLQVVPVAANVRSHHRNRIFATLLSDRPVSGGRTPGAAVQGGFALRFGEPKVPDPVRSRLRHLRECAGLTQAELAELVGVGGPTVSLWENGHVTPKPATRRLLAQVFKITTVELDALLNA